MKSPAVPVIHKTDKYEVFSMISWNRAINHANIKKLIEETEKDFKMHLFPILVDDEMRIIDGQHRFAVCEQLGCPVYYIIKENHYGDFEEIRSVNVAGRLHSTWDRFQMLLKMGDKNALGIVEIHKQMKGFFDMKTVLTIMARSGSGGNLNKNLSKGEIKLWDVKSVEYNVLRYLKMSDIVNANKNSFVQIIKTLCKKHNIKPRKLIEKLDGKGFMVKAGMNRSSLEGRIVHDWNSGLQGKNKI